MYWLDNNTGISTAPTTPAVISLTKKFFTNGGAGEQPSIPEDFWFNMVQEELLGALTMAGIAPVKNDLGQLAKAIQSIAFSAYPVGAPIPWPTAVPPSGFLVMTGQSFSAAVYPKLALAYPSLVIPDMRAEFIRGWDNGRGVDPSRALLSSQGDAIRNISATFDIHGENTSGDPIGNATGAFSYAPQAGGSSPTFSVLSGTPKNNGRVMFGADSVVPVASENRPRNISFTFIVRAA